MKRPVVRRTIAALAATLPALILARRTGFFNAGALISRRTLARLGGFGLIALLTEPWRNFGSADAAPSCVLSPEQTEGPYYIAREKLRSNITERRAGTLLKLRIAVVDASTCKPIKNAAVDIWHCDASGIYSGFIAASTGGAPGGGGPTDKQAFLRGIQLTNSSGICQFQTIYPGWYRGRTVHIHVKVHVAGDTAGHVVHTGQLYFSDSLTARVYQAQPYKVRAAQRDTFNNTDGIYANGGRQSTLTIKRDGRGGYVGTITLGVRRS